MVSELLLYLLWHENKTYLNCTESQHHSLDLGLQDRLCWFYRIVCLLGPPGMLFHQTAQIFQYVWSETWKRNNTINVAQREKRTLPELMGFLLNSKISKTKHIWWSFCWKSTGKINEQNNIEIIVMINNT